MPGSATATIVLSIENIINDSPAMPKNNQRPGTGAGSAAALTERFYPCLGASVRHDPGRAVVDRAYGRVEAALQQVALDRLVLAAIPERVVLVRVALHVEELADAAVVVDVQLPAPVAVHRRPGAIRHRDGVVVLAADVVAVLA